MSSTQRPQPPFAEQQQTWPGTTAAMQPQPDHGEQSYQGSGRLAGKKPLLPVAIPALAGLLPLPLPGKGPMS